VQEFESERKQWLAQSEADKTKYESEWKEKLVNKDKDSESKSLVATK
jgi:hypothetical protein